MKKQLTFIQGYKSMFFFLDYYYTKTRSEDIGSLMGDIMFIENDNEVSTSDPASWYDWVSSIYKTFPEMQESEKGILTYFQTFKVMYTFLDEYQKAVCYPDLENIILKDISFTASDEENSSHKRDIWKIWLDSIHKGLHTKSSAG